jgi:microcystin-dependent protein
MATALPAGTIISYVGSDLNNLPDKWILCDGRVVIAADYPALANALGKTFGVDPNGNPYAPDLRGMFLRGVDGGRNIDPDAASRMGPGETIVGGVVGSYQWDSYPAHGHTLELQGAANISDTPFVNNVGGNYDTPQPGHSETRPKNVYVFYLVYAGD